MNKDQLIMAGIINGDEQVLKGFYKEHVRHVQRYILQNSGNDEDVQDIFQDALLFLYQKLSSDSLEIKCSISSYFHGVCKNMWKNQLRKKNKLSINDSMKQQKRLVDHSLHEDEESKEREHLYRKYFFKLTYSEKKILNLFFEGKSTKEIAKINGDTEGYTRKKKFEAKKKLLAMIEKDPLYRELKT